MPAREAVRRPGGAAAPVSLPARSPATPSPHPASVTGPAWDFSRIAITSPRPVDRDAEARPSSARVLGNQLRIRAATAGRIGALSGGSSEAAREAQASRHAGTDGMAAGATLRAVNVHVDARSRRAARGVGAAAFSVGRDVFFDPDSFAPGTEAGGALLAHELGHVAAGHGALSRAVTPEYARIRSNLTYGIFDWAITDAEAREVLDILTKLAPADLTDTVAEMEKEGLLNRLLENVSEADRAKYASLIESIHRSRGAGKTSDYIERLMSYDWLDWAVTEEEAHLALDALLTLRSSPPKLRDVVGKIPQKQYERFYDNLSAKDRADNARFLQDLEMMRSSGMTFDEMTAQQRRFLEDEAKLAGQTVGEFIGGETEKHGYGGDPVTWWSTLSPIQKKAWTDRFDAVVTKLKTTAPKELRAAITKAEAGGGGIKFTPDKAEESKFFGAHVNQHGKHWLLVGKAFVLAAEANLSSVYGNVAHELGGHGDYGDEASWDVMSAVIAGLPAAERTKATGGRRRPFTAYGYPETEIYAELRELPFYEAGVSETDDPADDVEDQLQRIRQAYDPKVAEAIVRGLRRRIQVDDKITDAARSLYDEKVKAVFGIRF